MNNLSDNPLTHPAYGSPLEDEPRTIEGIVFRCYKTPNNWRVWFSEDFRIQIEQVGEIRSYYWCYIDQYPLLKRFSTFESAAKSGIKKRVIDTLPLKIKWHVKREDASNG